MRCSSSPAIHLVCSLLHALQATDEPVAVSERARRAKLPTVDDLECTDAVELHWRAFLFTLRAAREDQQQMDFDVGGEVGAVAMKPATRKKRSAPVATTATRRRRKSVTLPPRAKRPRRAHNKPKEESEEDEEEDEDDDGDDEFVE